MICQTCRRQNRRRTGKHRRHGCDQYVVGTYSTTRCDCPCNAIPADWEPPSMNLDGPPDTTKVTPGDSFAVREVGERAPWHRVEGGGIQIGGPAFPREIHASLIGGPFDGWTAALDSTPSILWIMGHRHERIDDPDTGEWLSGYVYRDSIKQRSPG